MDKITIRVKHYFGRIYMYLGLLMGMFGVILLPFEAILGGILLFLSILVFTTEYKLAIFDKEGYYHDYLSFLGFKKGHKHSYGKLNKLIISKHNYSQTLNARGSTTTIQFQLYKGFIVFDEDNKVLLGESKNRNKIEKRIASIKKQFNVQVEDFTGE